MRVYLFIITLSVTLFANNYTYLVDDYTKETELEAKVVIKIAKATLNKKSIKLYIPDMKPIDKNIYSKYVELVDTCQKANFVFEKYSKPSMCQENRKNLYILTSNYKKLLHNETYFGAFFWSKSRPNIVFIKKRLAKLSINLSQEYKQFIEDF